MAHCALNVPSKELVLRFCGPGLLTLGDHFICHETAYATDVLGECSSGCRAGQLLIGRFVIQSLSAPVCILISLGKILIPRCFLMHLSEYEPLIERL